MIRSMTGYGRAEGRYKGIPIIAEARSVNHRHCEVVMRLPRALQGHEDRYRTLVQSQIGRGRIELSVSVNGDWDGSRSLSLDTPLARQYLTLLRELKRALKLSGAPDVALLAGFRDIIRPAEQRADDKGAVSAVERVLERALKALGEMRAQEGRALERDLSARIGELEHRLNAISVRLPELVQEHAAKLQARVNRLLQTLQGGQESVDPGRLAQEVALLAERSDVSEEVTRLESHLRQFEGFLRRSDPVGRSLDFLLQEMNREVNTIGSKVGDIAVTQELLAMKAEMEKVREQVQNVE